MEKNLRDKSDDKGIPTIVKELLQVVDGHYWYEISCCQNPEHTSVYVTTNGFDKAAGCNSGLTIPNENTVQLDTKNEGLDIIDGPNPNLFTGYFKEMHAPDLEDVRKMPDMIVKVKLSDSGNGPLDGKIIRLVKIQTIRTKFVYFIADVIQGTEFDFSGKVESRKGSHSKDNVEKVERNYLAEIRIDGKTYKDVHLRSTI